MPELATEPDAALLAAEARRMIEMHDGNWDSLHAFATLHWDGEKFTVGTWCAIDTGFAAADYFGIMQKASFETLRKEPGNPPYAYALQIEAHVSSLPKAATPAEQAALAASLRAGKLHQRPDARECAEAWVADIRGRLWSARRFRDGDAIEEHHTPASGPLPGPAVFTAPLLTVARATGLLAWGLDATPEEEQIFSKAAGKGNASG